jgi:hypothetical protein
MLKCHSSLCNILYQHYTERRHAEYHYADYRYTGYCYAELGCVIPMHQFSFSTVLTTCD